MAAEADRAARNSDLSYEAHVLVDTVLSRAASSVLTMVTALNQRLKMPLSEAGLSAEMPVLSKSDGRARLVRLSKDRQS